VNARSSYRIELELELELEIRAPSPPSSVLPSLTVSLFAIFLEQPSFHGTLDDGQDYHHISFGDLALPGRGRLSLHRHSRRESWYLRTYVIVVRRMLDPEREKDNSR
jgi:hypothetical protein